MIKGVVQKIITKPFQGQTLTSFTLKGQDGFFSLGDKPATFNEGDALQFETYVRGKYTYAQNISPWTDGGTTSGSDVVSVANGASDQWKNKRGFQRGGSGGAAKEAFWDAKELRDIERERYNREVTQPRIEIQAARNAAIETVKFMWEKDLVPKPKKKADEYDVFLALVDTVASHYLANTKDRTTIEVLGSKDVETGVNSAPVEAGSTDQGSWD